MLTVAGESGSGRREEVQGEPSQAGGHLRERCFRYCSSSPQFDDGGGIRTESGRISPEERTAIFFQSSGMSG